MKTLRFQTISLIVVTGILAFRFFFYFRNIPHFSNGVKVRIDAKVRSEPILYSDTQYLKLSGYKIYLPLYPRIYYGDRVVVEGVVEDHKLKKPILVDIKSDNGFIYSYRRKLISIFERSLPKDHAAIVSGVTIGSKSGIGEELWEKLVKSGTAHVVVASGMNVSLISQFLINLLILVMPRKKALIFTLMGIWIYVFISGCDAPIVRAAVMGSTAALAVETGRIYRALRILFLTGIILLFIKPLWITDLGFWLSVLATGSIIIFYPGIKKIFSFVPKVVNENWSTTLAAQIGVVPILYYYFGQFNILSPIINVAVLWTIVPITIIGIIGGVFGTIWEPLGRLILYLCYPLTGWFIFVVSV